jgi:hypothetical protein
MASKLTNVGDATSGPWFDLPSGHAALVADFRAKLAAMPGPLDRVAPEQLQQAGEAFKEMPEVAGEPLVETRRGKRGSQPR